MGGVPPTARRRGVLAAAGGLLASGALPTFDRQDAGFGPLGSLELRGLKEAVVGPDGETAFVALTDGFGAVDVSDPADPTVLAERRDVLAAHENGPLRGIFDVKVDGDDLLVVGPAEEPSGSYLAAAALYDVGDPASPERRGFVETSATLHNAFLGDGYAYLAANDPTTTELVILDAGDGLSEAGRFSITSVDDRWERVDPFLRFLHDVWVHEGVAYISHWDAGEWIVDVSDPSSPDPVTHFGGVLLADLVDAPRSPQYRALPGNVHYAMVDDDGDRLAFNREAWPVEGGVDRGPGGVELWDVADATSPARTAAIDPPTLGGTAPADAWTTAHNFDLAGDRLYTTWYQAGVRVYDVADPASPERLAAWREPATTAFWTAKLAPGRDFFVASSWNQYGATREVLYTFPALR